ncbi:nucleotide-binding protein [Chryseobacterium gleum]|uniref:nucleotide-binding protein n=1 Tax=Chryseobacterium gleum TaxID=250 RepID=UPI0028A63FB7|nr:nucleotide-binding protein [Chryseobacterium gleum]
MKPKIFIGSSVESLEIAHNIQELLEHEANPTVWTQGIFELSNTALEDLIKALDSFDYAIFIFKPEDISTIRDKSYNTVRDNVIFELGLFIGKLGKDKVFFVAPKNSKDFHLPSDLAGITYGTYNAERDDENMLAALGPFCNQIRRKIKDFSYSNLKGFENEEVHIKDIVLSKNNDWEFKLTAELLKNRLKDINNDYLKLESNLYFKRTTNLDSREYATFISERFTDYSKLLKIFLHAFNVELKAAMGEVGVPGDPHGIKASIDKIKEVCIHFFEWEADVQSVIPPEGDGMELIPMYLKGWTRVIFDEMNQFPGLIYSKITPEALEENNYVVDLAIKLDNLPNSKELGELMEQLTEKVKNGYYI